MCVSLSLCVCLSVSVCLSQEFEFEDGEVLCDKLSALATDCNKHRTKVDKRKQRSVFRDVLRAVEVSVRTHTHTHTHTTLTGLVVDPE